MQFKRTVQVHAMKRKNLWWFVSLSFFLFSLKESNVKIKPVGSELLMFIELSKLYTVHSDIVINLEGRNDLSFFKILYLIFF